MIEFTPLQQSGSFPTALERSEVSPPRTLAELDILRMMAVIRNKQHWWTKVLDSEITARWRQEGMIVSHPPDDDAVDPHNNNDNDNINNGQTAIAYHQSKLEYALAECQWLARAYAQGPSRPAAVQGVYARDDFFDTTGSDNGQPRLDREKWKKAIDKLRERYDLIGARQLDRHPGSYCMIDLVHPSLYCYKKGHTRILADAGAECVASTLQALYLASATTTQEPPPATSDAARRHVDPGVQSIKGLQWLPSEFMVHSETNGHYQCQIRSYINSLHPDHHAGTYDLVAHLFTLAVPLLEDVLTESASNGGGGGPLRVTDFDPYNWWTLPEGVQRPGDEEWDDMSIDSWDWDRQHRVLKQPTIPLYSESQAAHCSVAYPDKSVSLVNRPLQVIVKIAQLVLEPDGVTSYAGSWHVEGMKDERIVATACCYIDSENVTGGDLSFRWSVGEPDYEQSDDAGINGIYGLRNEEALVQNIGSCRTTSSSGRILAWPNTHQHRVQPVRLEDPRQPGHRTIVCFFLVDPNLRVRSTATVPPQQLAWYMETVDPMLSNVVSAGAVRACIYKYLAALPGSGLMTYEEACGRREDLMAERGAMYEMTYDGPILREFSLCEH